MLQAINSLEQIRLISASQKQTLLAQLTDRTRTVRTLAQILQRNEPIKMAERLLSYFESTNMPDNKAGAKAPVSSMHTPTKLTAALPTTAEYTDAANTLDAMLMPRQARLERDRTSQSPSPNTCRVLRAIKSAISRATLSDGEAQKILSELKYRTDTVNCSFVPDIRSDSASLKKAVQPETKRVARRLNFSQLSEDQYRASQVFTPPQFRSPERDSSKKKDIVANQDQGVSPSKTLLRSPVSQSSIQSTVKQYTQYELKKQTRECCPQQMRAQRVGEDYRLEQFYKRLYEYQKVKKMPNQESLVSVKSSLHKDAVEQPLYYEMRTSAIASQNQHPREEEVLQQLEL